MRYLSVALSLLLVMPALFADNGPAHQAPQSFPIKLGTSGGNVNDITRVFCCSGTLGALVTKSGTQYILSNNHVLARVDQATPGEDVSQPGLVDNGCRMPQIVADFSEAPQLGSNVDAAIAQIRGGFFDGSGEILDVGVPASVPVAPSVGRGVAKSGRTTGLTCASIGSVNTNVSVQYQKKCGQGRKFFVTYTNQVVVNSSSFSAGGDSGSLIVTTDTAQPVALLYAGSSTTTIGNPIGDVISALGISFVGGATHAVTTCPGSGAPSGGASPTGLERAKAVKEKHVETLMSIEAVQGVGVGADEDGNAAIIIYTELGRPEGFIPAMIDGVKTRVIRTDEFRAFDWTNEETQ